MSALMNLTRRRQLTALLSALLAGPTLAQEAEKDKKEESPAEPVVLFYFGTDSCPNCRAWKIADLPKLQQSASFQAAKFVTVMKAITSPIPGAKYFPAEYASLQEAIAARFNGKIGSPMFAITRGSQVTWAWRGAPSNDEMLGALSTALKGGR